MTVFIGALIGTGALLSIPATIMGDRRISGVRSVKTLVTTVLAVAIATTVGWRGANPMSVAILIGVVLCVVADWLLGSVDNSATFPFGLGAFLFGYLAYGVAFITAVDWSAAGTAAPVLVYTLAALCGLWQYRRLRSIPSGLRIPVIAYVVIASNLLAASIVLTVAPERSVAGSLPWLYLIGGASIYLSDSFIAHHLFRKALPSEELWIMPTYYVGQLAIATALYLG